MAIKERRKAHGKVFMVEGGGGMRVRLLNLTISQPPSRQAFKAFTLNLKTDANNG
jgi:hypothetical protein